RAMTGRSYTCAWSISNAPVSWCAFRSSTSPRTSSCARKNHEKARRRGGPPHGSLWSQAASAIVRAGAGPRRADSRDPDDHGDARLPGRVVRRVVHGRPERRLDRAIRDALRQGSTAAVARRLPQSLEPGRDAAEEDDVQPRRSILVVARLEWH